MLKQSRETEDLAPAEEILERFGSVKSDDLIPLLQQVQKAYGYVPPDILGYLSEQTGIPTSRMYGVITFYAQFSLVPRGRHIVRSCSGTACHVRGAKAVREGISEELGIPEGGTTEDRRFSLETVACVGTCFLAPVMMVNEQYFGLLTADKATSVLKAFE
jgi:NADH-quinone oxidoreductase subunit E